MSSCSLSEHEEAARGKWRVGVSGAYTSTALRFGSGPTLDERRETVAATADYRLSTRWTLDAGAGVLAGGRLGTLTTAQDFSPGLSAFAGASFRILDSLGARPFVLVDSELAFVAASTHAKASPAADDVGYHALDLRLGAAVGWSLWQSVSPYFVARAFGGPVYWRYQGRGVTGTDTHHYQVGAGVSVLVEKTVDFFLEGVPIGERALSGGVGTTF